MSEIRRGRGSFGKRKSNYRGGDQRKRKSNYILDVGQKGFLCTCNFNEKQCIREAYNILNEYSDSLEKNVSELPEDTDEKEELDVEAALAKEVKALQEETGSGSTFRKFQVVETGLNNRLFIRTTVPDPVSLVVSIMEDVKSKKQRKTRFLLRMLPVETTCKANPKEMEEAFRPLIEKYFSSEGKTFSIIYRARYNNSAVRDEVIELFAGMIKAANPSHRADLNNPQLAVLVEIIKSICCIGVVPDFFSFRKYNLSELVSPTPKDNAEGGDADIVKDKNVKSEEDAVDQVKETDGEILNEKNLSCEEETNVQGQESDGKVSNEKDSEIKVETINEEVCEGKKDETVVENLDENPKLDNAIKSEETEV